MHALFARLGGVEWISKALDLLPWTRAGQEGSGVQADAAQQALTLNAVVSADPPYYDNIGYADLSDFFYVWLRRSLKPVFPELFATLAVPKAEELVATPYRHGGRVAAETFFLHGMTQALRRLAEQAHPGFPVTIYYAFRASCEKRVRPSFCLRRRGERGSADGTQRSQDGSDRHRRRGAGDAGVHGACLPVMRASTCEEMRRSSFTSRSSSRLFSIHSRYRPSSSSVSFKPTVFPRALRVQWW